MAASLENVVKQLADSGIIAPGKLENFVPPKAHPQDASKNSSRNWSSRII